MNKQPKIQPLKNLIKIRENTNKTIVTNNGSYDILHIGHVRGLQQAKSFGDILIVGVNSDASIKQYKSPDRPINPLSARMAMLAALACVDYVFSFNETTPLTWLEQLKPDIHTTGAQYGENCIEKSIVEKHGGKIKLLDMIDGFSSTKILEKLDA